MSTKTPEQRAEERIASEQYWATPDGRAVKRWPADKSMDGRTNLTLTKRNLRQGFATAIRELVEPRDRLLQELVDALFAAEQYMTKTRCGCLCGCPVTDGHTAKCPIHPALAKAKEQFGITPNT